MADKIQNAYESSKIYMMMYLHREIFQQNVYKAVLERD